MKFFKQFKTNFKYQLAVVLAVTFLVYANSLFNKILWDDHLFLENWPAITSFSHLTEIFEGSVPPGQDKVYRPLRGLFYTLDYQLFGVNPFFYHLQALLVHLSVTVLVFLIAREIFSVRGSVSRVGASGSASRFPRPTSSLRSNLEIKTPKSSDAAGARRGSPAPVTQSVVSSTTATPHAKSIVNLAPFFVALLFGIHPIHTETIDYIASSLETFGTLFFFGSFYLYLLADKTRDEAKAALFKIGSVVVAILAFFTYEMTLTLPALLVLYDFCFARNKFNSRKIWATLLGYGGFIAGAGAFLFVRFAVIKVLARTDYLAYSFYLTMLVMVKVFVRYILLLLLPLKQTAIHNLVGEFPASMTPYDKLDPVLSQSLFDFDVLAAIVVLAIFILVGIRLLRRAPVISLAIFWFFITLLPVAYIIPPGGAMAEKYLYIASFGFLIGLVYAGSLLYARLKEPWRQGVIYAFLLLVAFYALSTVARNTVWKDDIALFSDVVRKSPNNLLANYTLGIWYANASDYNKAIFHYQTAIAKVPEFLEARFNLGNIFLKLGKFDMAESQYKDVLKINNNYVRAKNILDNIPKLKESTTSAVIVGNQVYVNYSDKKRGLNFAFPDDWSFKEATSGAIIADPGGLTVEINGAKNYYDKNIEDYISRQTVTYGTLVNQGLAQIPSVESAYVRVWQEEGQSQSQSEKSEVGQGGSQSQSAAFMRLQFFLFKSKRIVEVMIYPAANQPMPVFDQILGSIKIE